MYYKECGRASLGVLEFFQPKRCDDVMIQAYVQHMNALLAVALHNYIFKHLLFPLANYIGSAGVMERRCLGIFYITFLELCCRS